VVAGDVHLAGAQVLDRLVDPAVPEAQLVGVQAEGPAEDLAAQADAEQRDPGLQDAAHGVDGVAEGGRVAGAGGEEHAVRAAAAGPGGEDLLGGDGRGEDLDAAAERGQVPRGGGLDAEVDGGDGEPPGGAVGRRDRVPGRRGDLAGQV